MAQNQALETRAEARAGLPPPLRWARVDPAGSILPRPWGNRWQLQGLVRLILGGAGRVPRPSRTPQPSGLCPEPLTEEWVSGVSLSLRQATFQHGLHCLLGICPWAAPAWGVGRGEFQRQTRLRMLSALNTPAPSSGPWNLPCLPGPLWAQSQSPCLAQDKGTTNGYRDYPTLL